MNLVYSPVTLDGEEINETALRWLAVHRSLADGAPLISAACTACGHSILSPTDEWIEPKTRHVCDACGAENRTPRKTFLNPLAAKAA